MVRKILKYTFFIILTYILLCLATPFNKFLRNRSIKNQINYLNKTLNAGYDDELQIRFPEGKQFSNSLLALSAIEYCDKNKIENEKYASIIDGCINRILSERNLSTFDVSLKPQYGMFYCGWTNLVLQSYIKSNLFHHSNIKEDILSKSAEINSQIISTQQDSLRILDTYRGSHWPADNLIGLISIDNDTIQSQWLDKILQTSQHKSGLINHAGSNKSKIRGSSQALMTYCLAELNYDKLTDYNKQYKKSFINSYLGIQLVKENENGSNSMDVDSGPVVLGYGASATIMNIKSQASQNKGSKFTWAAMNLIGFPIHIFNGKYYLLKKEPMLDLFLLWGCSEL
jgi:hypothetical protein